MDRPLTFIFERKMQLKCLEILLFVTNYCYNDRFFFPDFQPFQVDQYWANKMYEKLKKDAVSS